MKFAVIGGDARAGWLAAQLAAEGHSVRSYALEKAALPQRIVQCGSVEACVYGADWVILGVPAEKNGAVSTPLSIQRIQTEDLLTALHRRKRRPHGGGGGRASDRGEPAQSLERQSPRDRLGAYRLAACPATQSARL